VGGRKKKDGQPGGRITNARKLGEGTVGAKKVISQGRTLIDGSQAGLRKLGKLRVYFIVLLEHHETIKPQTLITGVVSGFICLAGEGEKEGWETHGEGQKK